MLHGFVQNEFVSKKMFSAVTNIAQGYMKDEVCCPRLPACLGAPLHRPPALRALAACSPRAHCTMNAVL